MTEDGLLSLLRNGVERSKNMIARITEYHGGPVTTEYMLVSDIARELIEKGHQVEVEYLNRKLVNGMTARKSGPAPKPFGSKRTDVVALSGFVPLAMIEIKINVSTVRGIKQDLVKMAETIDALKPRYASGVWGAAVFQVHVAGSERRYKKSQFRTSIKKIEAKIQLGLKKFSESYEGYNFWF